MRAGMAFTCTCMHVYIVLHIYCIYTHTYTHTHIYTHIHTTDSRIPHLQVARIASSTRACPQGMVPCRCEYQCPWALRSSRVTSSLGGTPVASHRQPRQTGMLVSVGRLSDWEVNCVCCVCDMPRKEGVYVMSTSGDKIKGGANLTRQ